MGQYSDTEETAQSEPSSEPDFPDSPIDTLELFFDEPQPNISCSLVSVRFGESQLEVGETFFFLPDITSNSQVVTLDYPTEDWLSLGGVTPEPSLMLVPLLHIDKNQDKQFNPEEPILGMSLDWLSFMTNANITEGWYQFEFSFDGGTPEFSNEGNILLETLFFPSESPVVTVSTSDLEPMSRIQSMAILSDATITSEPLYSEEVSSVMDVSLSPPPEAHFEPFDGELKAAVEILVVYTDENENEVLDNEEPITAQAGVGSGILTWIYIQPPLSLDQALLLREQISFEPVRFGWQVGLLDVSDQQGELRPVEESIGLIPY